MCVISRYRAPDTSERTVENEKIIYSFLPVTAPEQLWAPHRMVGNHRKWLRAGRTALRDRIAWPERVTTLQMSRMNLFKPKESLLIN